MTMGRNGVTLKDIAQRCGVTPTVVSAILNHRNGRISCSPAKREEITRVACEMNYRVNLLARSIRQRHVPIVGMLIHIEIKDDFALNLHINSYLTDMTYVFNRHNLEVLYIPYSSEAEQLSRCHKLVENGLVGGLIMDIIPDSHGDICSYLKEAGIPYYILGWPRQDGLVCAYSTMPKLDGIIQRKCEGEKLERCVQVIGQKGIFQCREYPFVDGYMWHTAPHSLEYEQSLSKDTFYAFFGMRPYIDAVALGFNPRHYMVLEDSRLLTYMPWEIEVLVVSRTRETSTKFCLAAEALSKWVNESIPPEHQTIHVDDNDIDYEFKTANGKGACDK
jgi:hypothetical protein